MAHACGSLQLLLVPLKVQVQIIDGEREQQPAEKTQPGDTQKNADDDHDGGLRNNGRTVAPSTTTAQKAV